MSFRRFQTAHERRKLSVVEDENSDFLTPIRLFEQPEDQNE